MKSVFRDEHHQLEWTELVGVVKRKTAWEGMKTTKPVNEAPPLSGSSLCVWKKKRHKHWAGSVSSQCVTAASWNSRQCACVRVRACVRKPPLSVGVFPQQGLQLSTWRLKCGPHMQSKYTDPLYVECSNEINNLKKINKRKNLNK